MTEKTSLFIASSSPHLHTHKTTRNIMGDVIIALIPATAMSIVLFGLRAFVPILVTIVSCVLSEYGWCRLLKKESTIGDFSAVVTGLLLAFNLPPDIPLWMAAVGGIFAIVIVKQFFGGLGANFINPALAARGFMMASWPIAMTTWENPFVNSITSATPLALIKKGSEVASTVPLPSLWNLFIGFESGCIGETSALALLLGGLYLMFRKVITIEIPLSFIGTVALCTWILGGSPLFTGNWMYHICAGGLFLGAFFMATDYATSPITAKGKIIMGTGCGFIASMIRLYGGYPEGVCYSILLMNLAVPLIDRFTIPHSFTERK